MNEIDWLKSIDSTASPARDLDVAPAVMGAIRASAPERETVFSAAALLSLAVGAMSMVIAIPTWLGLQDPVSGFATTFDMVLK